VCLILSVTALTLEYSTNTVSARVFSEMIAAIMIFVNSSTMRSDAVLSAMRLDRLAPEAVRVSRTEVLLQWNVSLKYTQTHGKQTIHFTLLLSTWIWIA
jgi:hypothetical protein